MGEPWSEKFIVVYESKKHEVIINGEGESDITLQDLSNAIAEKCGVPASKQKIICKGKTLSSHISSTLKDLGVSSKDKILLLGQRVNQEETKHLKAIARVGNNVEELRKKFEEKKTELNGIEQGFLYVDQGKESLEKLSKYIKGIGEGFMKQLESLDALTVEQNFTDARQKRKALISKIQNYLTETDAEEERITEMSSKL